MDSCWLQTLIIIIIRDIIINKWSQRHFEMFFKDEVGEIFRDMESESENFHHLNLETDSELKSLICLESEWEIILQLHNPSYDISCHIYYLKLNSCANSN